MVFGVSIRMRTVFPKCALCTRPGLLELPDTDRPLSLRLAAGELEHAAGPPDALRAGVLGLGPFTNYDPTEDELTVEVWTQHLLRMVESPIE